MKTILSFAQVSRFEILLWLFIIFHLPQACSGQGSAFTYQGRLTEGSAAATGQYDLTFTLWTNSTGPAQASAAITNAPTLLSNGLFTVVLDFGASAFSGPERWLEIGVRTNGSLSAYQTLSPRQQLTSAPYAVRAANLSGPLSDGQLSTNIARLDATQTFNGANIFAGGVGIGTTNPVAQLTVAGSGNSNTSAAIVLDNTGTNGHRWKWQALDNGGMQLADGASTRLVIDSSGRVGIGTNAPNRALVIASPGQTELGLTSLSPGGHLWALQATPVLGDVARDNSFQIIDRTPNIPRFLIGSNGFVGINTTSPTNRLHVNGGVSATAFINTCDRKAKENFTPVNPREILDKVVSLPITRWNYREMNDGPHLGATAQDFYAAFGLGGSDRTITTVDPEGVALAAIQGLNQKFEEALEGKNAEIANLRERLNRLEQMYAENGIGGGHGYFIHFNGRPGPTNRLQRAVKVIGPWSSFYDALHP